MTDKNIDINLENNDVDVIGNLPEVNADWSEIS